MSTPLVKLQLTSDVRPNVNAQGRSLMKGFNLRHGSIVYTHNARGGIGGTFVGNSDFFICDGDQDTADTKPFYIAFGVYEGRSERFDTFNYFHQRQALLGKFGETGQKRVDTAIAIATCITPEALAHRIINPKKKYFVGFFSADKVSPTHIMHNQIGKPAYFMIHGKKTLGKIYAENVAAFLQLV